MRTVPLTISLVAVAITGCGGSEPAALVPRHESVAQHLQAADRDDREADEHQRNYRPGARQDEWAPVECIDPPLAGVPSSGGEDLPVMKPCWTRANNPTAHHLDEARQHRDDAARHRLAAKRLLGAEAAACAGLSAGDVANSPFSHTEDIAAVAPYREHEHIIGAVVRFRRVPGLTAEWMEHALACHQARAAVMGYSATFHPTCPVSLYGVSVSVRADGDEVVVTVLGDDADIGAVVYGRAQALVESVSH